LTSAPSRDRTLRPTADPPRGRATSGLEPRLVALRLRLPEVVIVVSARARLDRHRVVVPPRRPADVRLGESHMIGRRELDRGVGQLLHELLVTELGRGAHVAAGVALEARRVLHHLAVVLDDDAVDRWTEAEVPARGALAREPLDLGVRADELREVELLG